VHKGQLLRIGQIHCVAARFVQCVAVQYHFGSKPTGAFYFDTGCKARHHNHRAQMQALSVVGHPLCVVACAHGDHAAG
jgi:hypothetical protein